MAAPPIVANAEAQASLNGAADIAAPPSVRAARSSKRLRIARELHAVDDITEAELGEHEGFHARCAFRAGGVPAVEAAVADVPGVPPWFGPALAGALEAALGPALEAALGPLQAQMNNFEDQMNNFGDQMNNFEGQMYNFEARQVNSVACDPSDPLRALTNQAGVAFANFPNTLQVLNGLNGVEMTALLNHYGVAAGGANQAKLHRIKKFIGMRIA